MAQARPEANVLAFEVYQPAVAQILGALGRSGVANVRVVEADAMAGFRHLIAAGSIDELWTFFPDPWRKARHHKRRLVDAEFVALAVDRLRPGARWRLATDWADYAEQMRSVLDAPAGTGRRPGRRAPLGSAAGHPVRAARPGRRARCRRPLLPPCLSRETRDGERQRWRLDLAYDGSEFSGWALQPGFRTVQGEVEGWLGRLLPVAARIPVVCAGRTDAGVHARGQVAHFDLPSGLVRDEGADLVRRLVHVLPDDIVVSGLAPAPPGFHARFSAMWRRYAYRISDGSVRFDPLLRHTVTRVDDRLDLGAMNAAAADILLGFRDFGAFCKRKAGGTSIRTLLELEGRRTEEGVLEFTVRADAFCHSMVRSLIGSLVTVGSGRRDRAWLAEVTRAAARDSTVRVMPPGGLTLEEIRYPADDQLGARALETRTVRELAR